MRLTVLSDYSLRVLMYLGIHDDRLCTIAQIAQSYGISENHLMKVVNRLGQCGFIETMRGRGGGLRLGREAQTITLGEVLRATEDDFQLVECFGENNMCRISEPCQLRLALQRALKAYFAELDSWTLADIVRNRKALSSILDHAPT
ncbi:MAG: Rrf2 family transcriptional regulator [Proteobacteria bacterium]|nr:Rrf2 family transcriptional regulator [Pseudomonadota bacterium]MBS0270963.1 Rrf2 family transcriptional regulator [Pseudomonadota bacterium]